MDEPILTPSSLEALGPDRVLEALPRTGRGPGLILLHDVDGIDERMRDLAKLYAEEGYVVFLPDLFWLKGIERTDLVGEGLDWEFWFFQEGGVRPPDAPPLELGEALEDVGNVAEALRAHPACTGQVAVVGYGLGASLAVYAAARLDVDVAVAYDPAGLDRTLPELQKHTKPLLVHAAGLDTPEALAELERFEDGLHGRGGSAVHVYEGEPEDFALGCVGSCDAEVLLAHDRTMAHLHRAIGPIFDLEKIWESHLEAALRRRDVDAVLRTFTRDATLNGVPTMVGARGRDELRAIIQRLLGGDHPRHAHLIPVARTVGSGRLVDEAALCFTFDRPLDFLLPGVPPTGRAIELPIVASASFRGVKIRHLQVYWDQASLLVQAGRLDEGSLPVVGCEEAHKVLDAGHPARDLAAA